MKEQDTINRQALLARLNEELACFKSEAMFSAQISEKHDYSNWDEEIERLESRGKVMAVEWLIHVVEVFGNEAKTTYNGWANYDTWNVMLWINNDQSIYHDTERYFKFIRGERRRPTYDELIQWLWDSGTITVETPDGVSWMASTLNKAELDMGVVSDFDAWKQYN